MATETPKTEEGKLTPKHDASLRKNRTFSSAALAKQSEGSRYQVPASPLYVKACLCATEGDLNGSAVCWFLIPSLMPLGSPALFTVLVGERWLCVPVSRQVCLCRRRRRSLSSIGCSDFYLPDKLTGNAPHFFAMCFHQSTESVYCADDESACVELPCGVALLFSSAGGLFCVCGVRNVCVKDSGTPHPQ